MSSLLRRSVNGTGNFPKNSNLQGCNIAKAVASAILQCSFSASDNAKFRRGAGRPFQRSALLGSSPQAAGATPHSPRGEIPPIAGEMSAKQTKGAWVRRTAIASFDGHRLSKVLLRYSLLLLLFTLDITLDKSNRTPASSSQAPYHSPSRQRQGSFLLLLVLSGKSLAALPTFSRF